MKKTRYVKPLACNGQWAKTLAALGFLFLSLLGSSASAQMTDPPRVNDVIIPDRTGDYVTGDEIHVLVFFSADMEINPSPPYDGTESAVPTIGLEIGDSVRMLPLLQTTSSGDVLLFRYEIQESDGDFDGIRVPADSLRLNGATIRKPGTTVDADLSHGERRFSYRVNTMDREILELFYYAMGGDGWVADSNWLSNKPLDMWCQDRCEVETEPGSGRVEKLVFYDNNLIGTIPPELGGLDRLRELAIYNNSATETPNQLSGGIPPELGNLTNLTRLRFSNAGLSGEIPSELGGLDSLQYLSLAGNDLSGEIPPELGGLENLKELEFYNNQLSGEIPPELGGLENLEYLSLEDNNLSGPIPSQLGNLDELQQLYLHDNQLSGPIPSELGGLANLQILDLSNNNLSGEIPPELGNLANVLILRLQDNKLSGEIPSELGSLTSLQRLYLYGNNLSGEIPPELGNLANVLILSLFGNNLSGEIPPELGSLAKLQYLYLSSNNLSGEIPSELGSLTSLQRLYLSSNNLSGEIPSELGSLGELQRLYLNSNNLSGEIPTQLGSLAKLLLLDLSSNNLSGEIPSELGSLAKLWDLHLNGNELSGEIPTQIVTLPSLESLQLDNNMLSGAIPLAEFEALTVTTRNFLQLSLWGNDGLTGAESISNELGKRVDRAVLRKLHRENGGARWDSNEGWLPFFGTNVLSFGDWYGVDVNNDGRVSELNLNNNNLAGPITDALEQLEHLEVLNLADNPMLSGTLPEGLMNSSLQTLNIRGTCIETPDTQAVNDWLMGVGFTGAECSAPPPRTCPPGQVGTPPNCSAPPPPDTGQPPEQVMGVGVMEGVEQLLVSWDPVSEADGYKIQWKSGSQQFDSSRQHITDASTTSYTISNLDAEREYMVRVIATKSGTDDGMPSREVPGTPRAADTTSPPQQPTTTGQGSGGCSIASNAGPGNTPESVVFNLLLVVFVLVSVVFPEKGSRQSSCVLQEIP